MLKGIRSSFSGAAALFIVVGIVMCAWPTSTASVLCAVAGLALIAGGVWKMADYFFKKRFGLTDRCDFAVGALQAVLGILLMGNPQVVMGLVPVLLGVMVLADSLFKVQLSVSLKKVSYVCWWHYLVMGLVCGAAAVVMMINPFATYELLSILLGATFIVNGLTDLWAAFYLNRQLKKLGIL